MTAPLFFADDDRLASAEVGDVVELGGAEGRHAATVRRLVAGERLDLSDGAGLLCVAEVTAVVGQVLHARVLERVVGAAASAPHHRGAGLGQGRP